MKQYLFYGAEEADVTSNCLDYPTIKTPKDLYDALSKLWCVETCAPRLRKNWSKENKTLGQCSITSFLAQDIFGGKVYGVPLHDGNYHCFNMVNDFAFDLTSEQFGNQKLDYEHVKEQSREVHFQKAEKKLRYEKLKELLKGYCSIQ